MKSVRYDHLYVHVPFCDAKCAYCSFYSLVDVGRGGRWRYLAALRRALQGACPDGEHPPVKTVFIGGGTPTRLDGDELTALLDLIRVWTSPTESVEFTVESNPESLTPATCAILEAGGVNRVSLGVQSFNPALRQRLGRAGDVGAIQRAVDLLGRHGIDNLNVDLIYGIPGQRMSDWHDDLRRACELPISHLSTYALTVEEGSRLAAAGERVDDELIAAMWESTDERVAGQGLRRYEVSNFSLPGRACRHNDAIWHGATYLGCGPAASSFDGDKRWRNVADFPAWLAGAPPEIDALAPERRAGEVLAFGMRTVRGWNLDEFRRVAGYDALALRGAAIAELRRQGLLQRVGGNLQPTRRGLLFADSVAAELL